MPGKKPTAKDLEFFKSQLGIMMGLLNGDIDRLQIDALGDGNRNELQGDEGESYAVEFSLELLERDESALQEVIAALKRIEAGSYGRCQTCDSWIVKDRLRAIPYARNCIGCQRASEAPTS